MGRRRDRGFTLIEALVVSVIVGILSVLAVVGYRKWVTNSKMMEAQNLVSNIRSAEESFRSENGSYLPVSLTYAGAATPVPTLDYPAGTPGAFKTGWGVDCPSTVCVKPNSWRQLGVVPVGPVIYGYAVVASNDPAQTPTNILVNDSSYSLAAMTGAPWYVVEADGDPLGTGTFTKIFGVSGNNEIFVNGGVQ
jgi:prepilin-type N-terminal cleavage/methylation domain-containing protein